jgi:hypothetical protein
MWRYASMAVRILSEYWAARSVRDLGCDCASLSVQRADRRPPESLSRNRCLRYGWCWLERWCFERDVQPRSNEAGTFSCAYPAFAPRDEKQGPISKTTAAVSVDAVRWRAGCAPTGRSASSSNAPKRRLFKVPINSAVVLRVTEMI